MCIDLILTLIQIYYTKHVICKNYKFAFLFFFKYVLLLKTVKH
jgi:hypothetical protein